MTVSEIKKSALENLKGKWGTGALLLLVYTLISMGIGFIYAFLNAVPLLNLVAYVGLIVVLTPMAAGLIFCFVELKRGNNVECIDYFKFGFSNFKKIWCVVGNVIKKIWVYLLLYFIIIFAMTFSFIFTFAFSIAFKSAFIAFFGCLLTFILIAAYIALMVLYIMKLYFYVLAPYILWDNPDMSAKDIVEKSELLMKGHRGDYFLLSLSFIGWAILSVFTFGIGLLWLEPYIQISFVIFYEDLLNKENEDNKNNEPEKLEAPIEATTIENTEIAEDSKEIENSITETEESDIKKVDVLDDDGNVIQ